MCTSTVGLIVTNDNVLQNKEENITQSYLISELCSLNYTIEKVSILPENVNLLAHEYKRMSELVDITIVVENLNCKVAHKALSKTFNVEMVSNEKFGKILKNLGMNGKTDDVIPQFSKYLLHEKIYPVVYLQRIYILKQEILQEQFSFIMRQHLETYRSDPVYNRIISIENCNSMSDLSDADINFNGNNCVKLSSTKIETLREQEVKVKELTGIKILNAYATTNLDHRILSDDNCLIKAAISDLRTCFDKYGPENVFIAFNGGKDCTVLLHLMNLVLRNTYPKFDKKIFCLYVQSKDPFPEQDEFLDECKYFYNLEVETVCSNIKEALASVLEKKPNLTACLMGTRRTDPYAGSFKVFQMTDKNWPQVMRVSPLLDWHYTDIWDYLLFYKIPYCKLYDMGYTSLGSVCDTTKNPSLKHYDICSECATYLPAYKLLDETEERNGRAS